MNEGLKITLAGEKNLLVVPAVYKKVTEVVIDRITDEAVQKRVTAFTTNGLGVLVLWEGAAYDAIGDWTNADVVARVNELLNK